MPRRNPFSTARHRSRLPLGGLAGFVLASSGCTVDRVPRAFGDSPAGAGPSVRMELRRVPFAAPFPNDLFTLPDPTSRTGRRVNVALHTTSRLQRELQDDLNQLEGFGVTAPITVSLTRSTETSVATAIDLRVLRERHGVPITFDDDAVYLLDLERGIPIPLEIGMRSHPGFVRDETLLPHSTPPPTEPSLELETTDERIDPVSGLPAPALTRYSPAVDVDSDGWLDVPNLLDPEACRELAASPPGSPEDDARDRCLADGLLTSYERDGDTLVLRPLIPLTGGTAYAVVLTDRLVDPAGRSARSPFATVYHPEQRAAATRVAAILDDAAAPGRFGDLAGTGLDRVAFTWQFTTAPVVDDLLRLIEGLRGRGPLANLEASYPPRLVAGELVGPRSAATVDEGDTSPPSWEATPECAPLLARPHALDGALLRQRLGLLPLERLGLTTEAERTALLSALENLSHLALARLDVPYPFAVSPASDGLPGGFDPSMVHGDRAPHRDSLTAWIYVPKPRAESASPPYDTVIYAHGYGSSAVEALYLAGGLAAQGLATVAFSATGHGPDAATATFLRELLEPTCYARSLSTALHTRSRDVDGDGEPLDDVGGDSLDGRPARIRDVVRQTALDVFAVARALRATGGETAPLETDFDGDGQRDVGGPTTRVSVFGRSLGGAAAILAGPLSPELAAVAALGAPGTMIDPWLRTGRRAALHAFTGAWLGPVVVGVPARSLSAAETRCSAAQLSLRLGLVDVDRYRELEFSCVDLAKAQAATTGGTVVVTNVESLERRCTRMQADGRFRVAFPADVGDRVQVTLYDRPHAVETYASDAGCTVAPDTPLLDRITTWSGGPVPSGTTDENGLVVCQAAAGCTRFQAEMIPAGAPLRSLGAGAGLLPRTPELRRWLDLARHVTAAGDPAAYAAHLGISPLRHGTEEPVATPTMLLVPVGSLEIPVDSQLRPALAAGLLPVLEPAIAQLVPELADYATPEALYTAFGDATPHQRLVSSGVIESLPRLARTPPAGDCENNELSVDEAPTCHPPCDTDQDCSGGRICSPELAGRCALPLVTEAACRASLYDPDALDQGRTREGELEATVPLRLARVAEPVGSGGLGPIWEPRLAGAPRASDFGGWAADKPTLCLVFPHLARHGADAIGPGDDCAAFDTDRYLIALVGRFLASAGREVYHLSHPATHHCLERLGCEVASPPP